MEPLVQITLNLEEPGKCKEKLIFSIYTAKDAITLYHIMKALHKKYFITAEHGVYIYLFPLNKPINAEAIFHMVAKALICRIEDGGK